MAGTEQLAKAIIDDLKPGGNFEEIFSRLYARYDSKVYRFFERKKIFAKDCEDLTQEVFISVYKGLKNLRELDKFESWLFTIAENAFNDWVRKNYRDHRLQPLNENPSSADEGPRDNRPTPEEVVLDQEKRERFQKAWQELPEQMALCVQYKLEGHSYQAIAALVGIGVETVRTHLWRARSALRSTLGITIFDDKNGENP